MVHRPPAQRILDGSDGASKAPTSGAKEQASTDPFVAEEDDPSKTNALDSSLWELEALRKHF